MPTNKFIIENHCYTDQIAFERWLKKQIGHKVYFDGDDMVDEDSSETIATFTKQNVTYGNALAKAKEYYGIV